MQRIVIQTENTPVNACNSLSIIGGQYIIVKLDSYSYQRLGIAAKHADFRLLKDRCYLSIIPLRKLQSTSNLLTRIRECFQNVKLWILRLNYRHLHWSLWFSHIIMKLTFLQDFM